MAGFDYGALGTSAIALIKQFSRPAPVQVLRSVDGAPPDADKPWRVGAPTVKTFNVQAVVLPFPQSQATPQVQQDLTIIVPGDAMSIAAEGDPATLLTKWQATDRIQTEAGMQYTILGISELKPGTDTMMFKMRLRQWQPISTPPSTRF